MERRAGDLVVNVPYTAPIAAGRAGPRAAIVRFAANRSPKADHLPI